MLIKDRKYRVCRSCKARHQISNEVYGCDSCRKILDMNQPEVDYLRANVHRHNQTGSSEEIITCSWACMAKVLNKVKCDYFVSLPFLHFEDVPKGVRAKDFFALMRGRSESRGA